MEISPFCEWSNSSIYQYFYQWKWRWFENVNL